MVDMAPNMAEMFPNMIEILPNMGYGNNIRAYG